MRRMTHVFIVLITLLFLNVHIAFASDIIIDTIKAPALQLDDIMKGEDFIGYSPANPYWSYDNKHFFFTWKRDSDKTQVLYQSDITGNINRLFKKESKIHIGNEGFFSPDKTMKAISYKGDIFLLEIKTMRLRQITQTQANEQIKGFSSDGRKILYESADNIFSMDIYKNNIVQLLSCRATKPPGKSTKTGYLHDQQLELFETFRQKEEIKTWLKEIDPEDKKSAPYLFNTSDKNIAWTSISPDMSYVLVALTPDTDPVETNVPNYVTPSGYTENIKARPKVGVPDDPYQLFYIDLKADTSFEITRDQLSGIFLKPEFRKEYKDTNAYDRPKPVTIYEPVMAFNGLALIDVFSNDYKDRWVTVFDPVLKKLVEIDHQHDSAWIAGPGIRSWSSGKNIGWYDDGNRLFFQSEKTGYSHLYQYTYKEKGLKQLTRGDFEIYDAELSSGQKLFYITSNKENPFERHFYHLPANGGEMIKITGGIGCHQVSVSPDEKYVIDRYSSGNQPWELYIGENKPNAIPRQITHSLSDQFRVFDWKKPQIIKFRASDGKMVPARLYLPQNTPSNNAAIIFVHGAGYLQNVHQWWSSYFREYMFHHYLNEKGYTVLDIDYRGSEGYGRDWRTAIYRYMGYRDLDDQVDGAHYLIDSLHIDPARVGIYGGSYGGFITLMAMFTRQETFAAGAALRSVTDWAHYNHGYTAGILNTPEMDSIAFRRSSPIYFAEGLRGQLLILHGMVDTNVHFQDVVRLNQRLIELKKKNWSMSVYPVEDHGFKESKSWTDEYTRIFNFFETALKNTK